jgi:DNA primase catalytic core
MGDEISLCCPFHKDDTPSMYINEKTKLFKCFGCEIKGNLITFISKLEKISYIEAVQKLLGDTEVTDNYQDKLAKIKDSLVIEEETEGVLNKTSEIYKDFIDALPKINGKELVYMNSRNIIKEVLDEMNIKSLSLDIVEYLKKKYKYEELMETGLFVDNTPRTGVLRYIGINHPIVFPFYYDSAIVAIQLRRLDNGDPRYLNVGDLKAPYNINAVLKSDVIFICEGIPDALSLLTLGKPAIGIIGAQNFKPEWRDYFIGKKVYVLFDNDEAGKKGAKYLKEVLGEQVETTIINLPEKIKDVNDFLKTKTGEYISNIRRGNILKF